ncbi:PINIT domain-containing protein [Myxozyma melibiosi]|uniref:PINIT domain-containing protein n=1 Tax=Myxozyma melibiosi TaxID=54550 RepID=A0ABR1F1K3_9ASCO
MQELIRILSTQFTVVHLKELCRICRLQTTGRKYVLQTRLLDLLNSTRNAGDAQLYSLLKGAIFERYAIANNRIGTEWTGNSDALWNYLGARNNPRVSSSSTPTSAFGATNRASGAVPVSTSARHDSIDTIDFPSSTFYMLQTPLTRPSTLAILPEHRSTVRMQFKLSEAQSSRLRSDPSYRVYLLSANSDEMREGQIQFPHSIEIRVNTKIVQANLRGLKNKPGTTKPADLTQYINTDISQNFVEIIYAYTRVRYTMALYIARKRSAAEIVTRIASGKHIPKDQVTAEIVKKNSDDDDIIVGPTILSLKCPISYSRIRVPIRSTRCNHIQCYDATSYIQLQEQAPTWTCPVCNIAAPLSNIAVDSYVDDVLKRTNDSIDSIVIETDGSWRIPEQNSNDLSDDDDDDDDRQRIKRQSTSVGPPTGAMEVIDASPARQGSSAAPAAVVIDLSDSEDELPAPSRQPPPPPPPPQQPPPSNIHQGPDSYHSDFEIELQHLFDDPQDSPVPETEPHYTPQSNERQTPQLPASTESHVPLAPVTTTSATTATVPADSPLAETIENRRKNPEGIQNLLQSYMDLSGRLGEYISSREGSTSAATPSDLANVNLPPPINAVQNGRPVHSSPQRGYFNEPPVEEQLRGSQTLPPIETAEGSESDHDFDSDIDPYNYSIDLPYLLSRNVGSAPPTQEIVSEAGGPSPTAPANDGAAVAEPQTPENAADDLANDGSAYTARTSLSDDNASQRTASVDETDLRAIIAHTTESTSAALAADQEHPEVTTGTNSPAHPTLPSPTQTASEPATTNSHVSGTVHPRDESSDAASPPPAKRPNMGLSNTD